MKKAAILAAGEGSRLKTIAPFKPIVKINNMPLLELTFKNLNFQDFNQVNIIFNEEEKAMDLITLPCLRAENTKYFFKSTPSSMHSLYEVALRLNLEKGEHFFISMVDSIVPPTEAKKFYEFCLTIKENESALLVTSFIEDEKPLTLKLNNQGYVEEFECPIAKDVLITSGVYYFSEKVIPLLLEMITNGQTKMRNFLAELVKHNHCIKVYQVKKTLDIDRPEDIKSAEAFLKEYET